jgi:8-oxo-dGTP pyrophosphatase MutT (NUDIX family)
MRTRSESSAGGVAYRRSAVGVEIALASRRTQAGELAWGLPKGRIDPGEDRETTALREVREEAGLICEIEASLGKIAYWYVWEGARISKVVHFYLMRTIGGDTNDHDHEMEEVRWFPLKEALAVASYRSEREILERAAELL